MEWVIFTGWVMNGSLWKKGYFYVWLLTAKVASCKMQPEINTHFILTMQNDSNQAGKDVATHTSLTVYSQAYCFFPLTLFYIPLLLRHLLLVRKTLWQGWSRKDKEVKLWRYSLPPTRAQCTHLVGWPAGGWKKGTGSCRALHRLGKVMLLQQG